MILFVVFESIKKAELALTQRNSQSKNYYGLKRKLIGLLPQKEKRRSKDGIDGKKKCCGRPWACPERSEGFKLVLRSEAPKDPT